MNMEKPLKLKNIRNSVIVIGSTCEGSSAVEKALKDFDIADKTPLECFDFLRKLKSLL